MDDIGTRPLSEETASLGVYCLFCLTGHEEAFDVIFHKMRMNRIPTYVMRTIIKNGKKSVEKRQLLPGYILFTAENFSVDDVNTLRQCSDFRYMLAYENGDYRLRGKDLEFVNWMLAQNGIMDISRVYREGDRIKVVDGPLKNYEGSIISVNKKRSCAAIQISDHSILKKIWCSIEYIESV